MKTIGNLRKLLLNLLDFKFLETKGYHSSFHLWEDREKEYMLTDLVEIHFIELPKFREAQNKENENEALKRWLTFLQKDVSREVLEELMKMEPAIKMAEEKLDYLSSDPKTIELYKAREYSAHEKANLLSTGMKRAKIDMAKKLLDKGMDIDTILEITELSIEQIMKLKEEINKI